VVEYNSTYSAHDCFVKSVMAFVFGWLLNCKINVNCNELKLGTPATSPGGGGKDNGTIVLRCMYWVSTAYLEAVSDSVLVTSPFCLLSSSSEGLFAASLLNSTYCLSLEREVCTG